jgi:hypothetical protein
VDSIATERILHRSSQSASACRSRVKVGKLRTGCGSRSALTATYNSLAPTSIPAASGCSIGSVSHLLLLFLAICPSGDAGRMPGARNQSKLPIEIVAGNRQASSHVCTQPQTHVYRSGFVLSTNVGAGCSCHPTGIRDIFARLAFLCTLSGQGQLHAYRYVFRLKERFGDYARVDNSSCLKIRNASSANCFLGRGDSWSPLDIPVMPGADCSRGSPLAWPVKKRRISKFCRAHSI